MCRLGIPRSGKRIWRLRAHSTNKNDITHHDNKENRKGSCNENVHEEAA